MLSPALLLLSLTFGAPFPQDQGSIRGAVVNVSAAEPRPCQATVMLRVLLSGRFVPFRQTTSDAAGRFQFDHLPVGEFYQYLAGASRDGIYYPGPRIQLTQSQPEAAVQLSVYDAVTHPSPLLLRTFDITVVVEPGVLRVTESLLVDNPSSTCYVGRPLVGGSGEEPVTLQLAVPADFDRTTFAEEFFGRRFSLVDGKLVTGAAWPPGRRELKYTYTLRNTAATRHWERPLDLPCGQVHLRVVSARPDEVACDLPSLGGSASGEVAFGSQGQGLPVGHVIHLTLGHLPLPWMTWGRWAAVALLAGLIAATSFALVWQRRWAKQQGNADGSSGTPCLTRRAA